MPPRSALAALLFALALAAPLAAEDLTLRYEKGKPYAATVEIAADGTVMITPTVVKSMGPSPNPTPGPTPTPNPTPGPLTPFQQEVQKLTKAALAKGGTETTGAGISSVYSLAADAVEKDTLDVAVAADAVRRGTTAVVKNQREELQWVEFVVSLDDTITTLRAQGSLKTKGQFVAIFREIAKGMDSATGFKGNASEVIKLDPAKAGILGNIDLAKLIELIKLILELFKIFSPVPM